MHIVSESHVPIHVLCNDLITGIITLPTFQRNKVWKKLKKSGLMDTVYSSLYIPVIYLYRDPITGQLYILDGQQRLYTFRDWELGNAYLPKVSRYSIPSLSNIDRVNLSYVDIQEGHPAAHDFYLTRTVMVIVLEGTKAEAMEEYRILNLGAGLKLAEIYKSTDSVAVDYAKNLAEKHWFFKRIGLGNQRQEHLILALRLLLLSGTDHPISLGQANTDALVDRFTSWGDGNIDELKGLLEVLTNTLITMKDVFPYVEDKNRMFSAITKITATYWLCKKREYDPENMGNFLNKLDKGLAGNSAKKADSDPILAEINSCFRDATAQRETVTKLMTMFCRLWDDFVAGGCDELVLNSNHVRDLVPMKTTGY